MEKSARMDSGDFGSLPPLKSNDVKVITGVLTQGITYMIRLELIKLFMFPSFLFYLEFSVMDMDAASYAS